jgi:hypothetical protein
MKRSRLLWGAALIAGLVTTQTVALSAAPAHAVSSISVVSSSSASNSTASKTITVECPLGSFLYGTGGGVTGGTGSVSLDAAVPEGNPPFRARVTATELGAFSGNWSVSAWATCGPFTNNLQIISTPASPSTATVKERSISCPTGLGLYGTGFRVSGGGGNVLVHDVIPGTSIAPKGLTVRATARPGFAPNWGLEAFGICATAAPTMRVEQALTTLTSSATRGINRTCTTAGTVAHGVGVQTLSENPSTAVDGRIALSTVADLFSTVGSAGAAENGAVAENWKLQVYVICSN